MAEELNKIFILHLSQSNEVMKLKFIIQSEVNQKKKHQYSILTHIYRI